MTGQQLKNSILQMAVSGKLVPQDPNDEPASVLLDRIRAEKERLVKEGKIKKEKNPSRIFRGSDNLPYEQIGNKEPVCIADEVPFEIPESWEWCRLGSIITLLLGTDFKPEEYNNQHKGIPYITGASNISGEHVLENRWTENPHVIANEGDLLLVCKGSGYGKTVICDLEEAHIARQIMAIKKSSLVSMKYIQCVLSANFDTLKAKGQGVIPGIDRNSVLHLLCPLPPHTEQERIIAEIDKLLPFIEEYTVKEKQVQSLNDSFPEQLRKSILQYAVQGKLVPQDPDDEPASVLLERIRAEKERLIATRKIKRDKHESVIYRRDNSHYEKIDGVECCIDDEIPFELPKGWAWCYISNIAFVTKLAGFEYTKYIAPNLQSDGIPLFKGKNVQDGELIYDFESYIPETLSDELFRSQLSQKCLLTPYVGTIGNIAIFDGGFKAHLGSNVGKIEILNPAGNSCILEEYVLYFLKSVTGYMQLTKHKKATAQESISIDAIRNCLVAIPPLNEQKRIICKIKHLFTICEKLSS